MYEVFFKSGDSCIQNEFSLDDVFESIEQHGYGGKEVVRRVFEIDEQSLTTNKSGVEIVDIDISTGKWNISMQNKKQVWPEIKSKGEILNRKRYLRPANPVRENQTKRFLRPEGVNDN
jgi:hypothetical protein